jgi:hypothetical protein
MLGVATATIGAGDVCVPGSSVPNVEAVVETVKSICRELPLVAECGTMR